MGNKNLHLGCGERFIPGFIHIDYADFEHIEYRRSIVDLSIFDDDSIQLIYCSHALEYFNRYEVVNVLKEWHRVLEPGGVLRIAVPDFEAIVQVYLKYADLEHEGILGPLYGKWQNSNNTETLYHKTTYDFNSLSNVMRKAGFNSVGRYDVEKTIHSQYDDYSQAYVPHMDKENGILISLNVEAVK